MTHHHIKSSPTRFKFMKKCSQFGSVRFNDRNYQVGDWVTFYEYDRDEGVYTGERISGIISHVDDYGCQPNYVNLSIDRMGVEILDGSIPEFLRSQAL